MSAEYSSFLPYFLSPVRKRLTTKVISVGDVLMGGDHPVRIQSMTNTDTNNIKATVSQAEALARAGCDFVRITAQGVKEAENLALIKKELRKRGIQVPLIADIHFNPRAAETAARLVEKIRINPGNYIPSSPSRTNYSQQEYAHELEMVAEKLKPLLDVCRHYGTAVRIGVNHGSLGQRIMSRYGDTPEGMAESAMEYIRICNFYGFENLVLSMKSSNVRIMVYATRLLADKMIREGLIYPLHLGVTEAGNGMDGIIKSASGTGALLMDGIGDTIRVSLTGDPVQEVPVAKAILRYFEKPVEENTAEDQAYEHDPFSYSRRSSLSHGNLGGNHPVQVIQEKDEIPCLVDENGSACGVLTNRMLKELLILSGNARQKRLAALSKVNAGKPVILKSDIRSEGVQFMVDAAIETGSLLVDGIGDGIWLSGTRNTEAEMAAIAFSILQATRARITRTEFISCPSCGRTLFDIEETLSRVKAATAHLSHLKIAVMGCIVNGPGEMADADYGLVGAGPDRASIYKSKDPVLKNIPVAGITDALIKVIRDYGDWKEPDATDSEH